MAQEEARVNLARKLSNAISMSGVSQKELASKVGVSETTISRYRNGERMPSIVMLAKICSALGISFEYFRYMTEGKGVTK